MLSIVTLYRTREKEAAAAEEEDGWLLLAPLPLLLLPSSCDTTDRVECQISERVASPRGVRAIGTGSKAVCRVCARSHASRSRANASASPINAR